MTRRIAAILAADVVGYSRLMEQDESRVLSTMRMLRSHAIDPLLAQHQGRIVKLMGDGALMEFSSVVDAVSCAVALQKRVGESQAGVPADRRIVFRIGINLGDVVVEGNDLLGDGVNIAARLEQLCEPGGILLSGTAYDQLHGKIDIGFLFVGEQKVKNIERKVRVYRAQLGGGSAPARQLPIPKAWLIGAAAGVLAVVLVTGGLGWWLLQPEEGDPIAELQRLGPIEVQPAPLPGTVPEPLLAPTQPASPPSAPDPPQLAPPTPTPAQAAVTPAPVVVPAQPAALPGDDPDRPIDRVDEVRDSITAFDGGKCFFALPMELSENAATVEAYSASLAPVQTLDETFKRDNGFEAQIGLRQVTEPQCAAVEFMNDPGTDSQQAPEVQLDSLMLRDGETLLGNILDRGGRALAVLLVADDGTVHNLSDTMRGSPGRVTFEVKLTGSGRGDVKPLLLMVLASPRPLITLDADPIPAAAALFPILEQEAELSRQQIGVALKYLKLES